MITDKDILKLKAVFATKDDLVAMEMRLEKRLEEKFVTRAEFFEQMTLIAQEFAKINARLDRIEKILETCLAKLLDHERRLTALESKVALN